MQVKTLMIITLILTSVSGLGGCRPNIDAGYVWRDYAERLENVIAQPYQGASFKPALMPKVKRQTKPRQTISILDTLSLNHCQLGRLIAEHNSSLGKVAPASQRLIYQLKFIQLAPTCIDTLTEGQLKQALIHALNDKRQSAMDDFHRVLTQDKSVRKSLFIGYDSLRLDQMRAGLIELESALSQLLRLKRHIAQAQWHLIDTQQIEAALQALHQQRLLPQYLRSLSYSSAQLGELNHYLTRHTAQIACRPGHANRRQEILQNVFHKYYLAQIQTYLSQLNQLHYRLSEPMLALFDASPYQDYVALHFAEHQGALPHQLKQQMRQHVKWWQAFRTSCNIPQPGH